MRHDIFTKHGLVLACRENRLIDPDSLCPLFSGIFLCKVPPNRILAIRQQATLRQVTFPRNFEVRRFHLLSSA